MIHRILDEDAVTIITENTISTASISANQIKSGTLNVGTGGINLTGN